MTRFDVAIVGAGIAGASVAAELSSHLNVLLLEMEAQPGYHTTGRSAAVFAPIYGPPAVRALTRASEQFFRTPPSGFAALPLFSSRGILMMARPDQEDELDNLLAEVSVSSQVKRVLEDDLRALNPLVRSGYASAGMYDQSGQDIDVAALHQGYLRRLKSAGGTLISKAEVTGLSRSSTGWTLTTMQAEFTAEIVVNAAGAWAEKIGAMAGAEKIGLIPKRRTALMVAAPNGPSVDHLPITIDISEEFYLKPDAGRLLISPADETPVEPSDAQPEEMDVATCIDRIETAFDLSVRKIENKWAGLRSFVADKTPVAGLSKDVSGFFWLAGQGGYGIQTAPALSRMAAAKIRNVAIPADILDQGLDPKSLESERLSVAD